MPADAPMRLPAASTPICFMLTPPSRRALRAASAARSTVSLSACLPNFVMWIPRIHTSSLAIAIPPRSVESVERFEAEAHRLRPRLVGAQRIGGQLHLHAQLHVLWIGDHVDEVGPHARPVAVDHGGHEGHRNAGGCEGDDGEGPDLSGAGHAGPGESGAAAGGAGVAPVEVAGAAPDALVGDQVRVVS